VKYRRRCNLYNLKGGVARKTASLQVQKSKNNCRASSDLFANPILVQSLAILPEMEAQPQPWRTRQTSGGRVRLTDGAVLLESANNIPQR